MRLINAYKVGRNMNKIKMFNVSFDNITFNEFAFLIDEIISKKTPKYVVTCNVDHIMQLKNNKEFKQVYDEADVVTADGVPVIWASKLLKKPLKEKISGSDIFSEIGGHLEKKQHRIFFLGAGPGIADSAAKKLKKEYPKMNIVGSYSPSYGFEKNEEENYKIIQMIQESKADILFVGLGAPKQEIWIHNNYKKYNVPVSIGVGATFDFLSGNVKRAPKIFQKIGMEWLWRLCSEPKRLWKRYLMEDTKFLFLVFKELKKR